MSIVLRAEKRISGGPKSRVRQIRKQGGVPGIVYGGGQDGVEAICIPLQPLMKEMRKPGFFNHIFQLEVEGKTVDVLARDVHFHPVNDLPLHVDFMRVQADARVTVSVPLQFINHDKSPALKQGAIFNVVVHSLELSVPVQSIPENLVVDLDGLQIGDSIHLDRLNLSPEWRVVHAERDVTLATVVAPSGMTEETSEGAGSA